VRRPPGLDATDGADVRRRALGLGDIIDTSPPDGQPPRTRLARPHSSTSPTIPNRRSHCTNGERSSSTVT
jgi:hypothetical protein